MSINKTILIGRLTKDVSLRYTPNGKAVSNGTIAIDRTFKNQNGDNEADFINIVSWGRTAENLANYMKKGSQVGVDGRLQSRTYENQDGRTVFVTEVVADNIQFLETKSSNSSGATNNSRADYKPKPSQSTRDNATAPQGNLNQAGEQADIGSDDLPF